MSHLTSLHIGSYRGLKNVSFKEFTKLNLFVGENNAGKTSVIEIIQLMSNPLSAGEFQNVSRMRERSLIGRRYTTPDELLMWMLP